MTNPPRIDLILRSDTNELEPRKKQICLRIETIEFTPRAISNLYTYGYIAVPAMQGNSGIR